MITSIKEFLAEKRRIQENLEQTNVQDANAEVQSQPASMKDELTNAAEVAAQTAGISIEELNAEIADTIEAVNDSVKECATNESIVDTIGNAISTFGAELGNFEHMSLGSGLVIGAILVGGVGLLWKGLDIVAKRKLKKALFHYVIGTYQNEIKALTPETLDKFVADKTIELKNDKMLIKKIEDNPDYYIQKYGELVKSMNK